MAKFCPNCGTPTIKVMNGGRERDACPNGDFIQFTRATLGVGGLVFRDGAALLAERGIPPVGLWTIPSGFVEQDEHIATAVEREIKEETNLDVTAKGVVFLRNSVAAQENSMYCVFYCEADPNQQPVADGEETLTARFVPPDEFDSINLSVLSRWLIESYLENPVQPLSLTTVPGYRPNGYVFRQNGVTKSD
jgi:ADP-ribose pyrophosphatase YjhB (NUDIX family)